MTDPRYIVEEVGSGRTLGFMSLRDAARWCGCSEGTVRNRLDSGRGVNGWTVRTPEPRKVAVIMPGREAVVYPSMEACIAATGLGSRTVVRHIWSGEPDSMGRCYDWWT